MPGEALAGGEPDAVGLVLETTLLHEVLQARIAVGYQVAMEVCVNGGHAPREVELPITRATEAGVEAEGRQVAPAKAECKLEEDGSQKQTIIWQRLVAPVPALCIEVGMQGTKQIFEEKPLGVGQDGASA